MSYDRRHSWNSPVVMWADKYVSWLGKHLFNSSDGVRQPQDFQSVIKDFHWQIILQGSKVYRKKSKYQATGIRVVKTILPIEIQGIKKYKLNITHRAVGAKKYNINFVQQLEGIKINKIDELKTVLGTKVIRTKNTIIAEGKRNINNILEVLDIL